MSVEWAVQATEFANCNCAYGCGSQFNALPAKGFCEAVAGYQIDQGISAMSRWTPLRAVAVYRSLGPVHEGNGTMQIVIDERADDRQRDPLSLITLHPPRHNSVYQARKPQMLTVILIILILLFLGGGFGASFGGWGGGTYGSYGYGGIGLGTILLIVLIVLLLRGA